MARKKGAAVAVESVRHKDKRKNIPTEELRSFVAADEAKPKTVLYPRDPSLDPQLVWKGKDEQDQQDLAVPAVPIYIQEKIHPQALIEDVVASGEWRVGKDTPLTLTTHHSPLITRHSPLPNSTCSPTSTASTTTSRRKSTSTSTSSTGRTA